MNGWKGNSQVFRTYLKCKLDKEGKSVPDDGKLKGRQNIRTFEDASQYDSFGALLQEDVVDISFDSDEANDAFWKMSDANGWNCLILENPVNGHIHSFWKDTGHRIQKDGRDRKLAVGLIADIHSGDTMIRLKVGGTERFPPSFEPEQIQEVPEELLPVDTNISLMDLKEGEGRNDTLFKYILILQSQLQLDRDGIRRVLQNTNQYIFKEPLSDDEFDTITREEAFEKPVFYQGRTFLHNVFAQYIARQFHIKRINGQLHVYQDGIYVSGYRFIESKMVETIPTLKQTQRTEVLKYLEIMTPENESTSDAHMIAFRNGIYDIGKGELIPFSPEYVITNKIPWDYNPNAYDALADKTLNKISCNDEQIRHLLEEAVGYCFFRQNELSKSFMLVGRKTENASNGKSTFLDMVEWTLGSANVSNLDIEELGDRFNSVMLAGKLANIGDDISDEFLQGREVSIFKKVVSGNAIKAENKGQDVFFFRPYTKLLFSANEIPRFRNKGFEAIKRRLIIIPFNATFSPNDPDFDGLIRYKLKTQQVAEYMVKLGIEGLIRVLSRQKFTDSSKVTAELQEFERDNNPVLLFLDDTDEDEVLNHETKEVFARYDTFCYEQGYQKMAMQTFSKEITRILQCHIENRKIKGKSCRIFIKNEQKGNKK